MGYFAAAGFQDIANDNPWMETVYNIVTINGLVPIGLLVGLLVLAIVIVAILMIRIK